MVVSKMNNVLNHNTLGSAIEGRMSIELSGSGDPSESPSRVSLAVIAMGGSGKRTLNKLVELGGGSLPPNVQAVAFDSDPDLYGLPPQMVVTLTLPQADLIVKLRSEHPAIDQVLTPNFHPGKVTKGSKMKRMVTSMLLAYYRDKVRQEIRQRIVLPTVDYHGPGEVRLQGGRCRVVVILVGSVGGGFGSASKDELAAATLDEFRKVHSEIPVSINWYAFTPAVHVDLMKMRFQKSRLYANGLAALLEQEATYDNPQLFPWKSMNTPPFANRPLIDDVYLFDLTNEQGVRMPENDVYQSAANAIFVESLAAVSDPAAGRLENVEGYQPREGAVAPFGGVAAYSFCYPAEAIGQYAIRSSTARVLRQGLTDRKATPTDLDRLSRDIYTRSGFQSIYPTLDDELGSRITEIPTPRTRDEFLTAPRTLRIAVREWEERFVPRTKAATAQKTDELATKLETDLTTRFQDTSSTPSRYSARDLTEVADTLLDGIDHTLNGLESTANSQRAPEARARFDRSLMALEQIVQSLGRFSFLSKARKAFRQAVQDLEVYARATQQTIFHRAAAEAISRGRSRVRRFRVQVAAAADVGEQGAAMLERASQEVLEGIGQCQVFVRDAVSSSWAKARVEQILGGIDWTEKTNAWLGPKLAGIASLSDLERVVNTTIAPALEPLVRPLIDEFDVSNEETLEESRRWLHDVLGKAAPQFAFNRSQCSENDETYYASMLAVNTQQDADRLLGNDRPADLEILPTGDPHRITYLVQRRLVPLSAALNNYAVLVEDYERWVRAAVDDAQAQPHAHRCYPELNLCEIARARIKE